MDDNSSIILDSNDCSALLTSFMKRNDICKNVTVLFTQDSAMVEIIGINYKTMPLAVRLPLKLLVGDDVELEIKFELDKRKLSVKLDLLGIGASLIQNIPALDNLLLMFVPELKDLGIAKIESQSELSIDLSGVELMDMFEILHMSVVGNNFMLIFNNRRENVKNQTEQSMSE